MDRSICQEKKDLIGVSHLSLCLNTRLELSKEWCEKGRSTKSNLWECLSVSGKHVLNSEDFWILWVSIHGKAVVHIIDTHMSRDSTEAEEWELLIGVIWLEDLSDLRNRRFILVVGSEIMEGA